MPAPTHSGADGNVERALFRVEAMAGDISEMKDTMKQLVAAVSRLAIIEERQSHDRAEIGRAFKRLDGHDHRIRVIEQAQPLQKKTTEWVEKVFWLVIGAVVAGVMSLVIASKAQPQHVSTSEIPQLTMPITK